jgi:hypothetical protein
MAQTSFIENLLNLSWLFLVVASLIWWHVHWSTRQGERGRRESLLSLLALSCLLMLLFPVISLTDDLQEIPALVEYATSSPQLAKNSKSVLASLESRKRSDSFTFANQTPPLSLPAAFVGWVVPAFTPSHQSAPRRQVQGRAPPR